MKKESVSKKCKEMTWGKRFIAWMLVGMMVIGGFTGCGSKEKAQDDSNTLRLTQGGQKWWPELMAALEEEFPDITFERDIYYGPNSSQNTKMQLDKDDFGDIYIGGYRVTDEDCKAHLLDLSGYEFVGNYDDAILDQYDTEGGLYQLPGLLVIRVMAYNKDLFREKGWKMPESHEELVALCRQIREEAPEITPIAFATVAPGYAFTTVTTLSQADMSDMLEFKLREDAYMDGSGSISEIFQSGMDMTQELIDAGAYDVELDSDEWDSGAMRRMVDGEAAMCAVWGSQDALREIMETTSRDIGLFPFYGRDASEKLLGTGVTANIGLSKSLKEKGNEKKLENAIRVMEFLTTEEGLGIMRNSSAEIMPLKNAVNDGTNSLYREVWEENISGMRAPMLYGGYEDILVPVAERILEAMRTGGSLDGILDMADEIHKKTLEKPDSIALAMVEKRFTKEETVQFITNMLHTSGYGDVTLVSVSGMKDDIMNKTGVSGKIYEGAYGTLDRSVHLPVHFSAPMLVRELTGAEIKTLIQDGKKVCAEAAATDKKTTDGETAAYFDYYWAGADVVFDKGKVVSMHLSDGTEVTDEGVYRVQFAKGDYTPENEAEDSAEEQEMTPDQIYSAYLDTVDTIAPPEVPER